MTDFDTYNALEYWITSHTYSEYTCWGAIVVGEAMTELGYPYIQLACSYNDNNGWFYNDYSRYYSLRSKLDDAGYNSLGHRITLIYMKKGKFLYCEVQGGAEEGTKFVFNPSGCINVNIKMYIFDHLRMYKFVYSSSCVMYSFNRYDLPVIFTT